MAPEMKNPAQWRGSVSSKSGIGARRSRRWRLRREAMAVSLSGRAADSAQVVRRQGAPVKVVFEVAAVVLARRHDVASGEGVTGAMDA